MKELKQRIYDDGLVIGDDILKVDAFINHQIDTRLLDEIGAYLASKFSGVTKILTIEASGIAFACSVARYYDFCPVVFAKKSKSKTLADNLYSSEVKSFTHGNTANVIVNKKFLNENDKVLIVDDFLAEGNASLGLLDICNQAGAKVIGCAIVIEKEFQGGRLKLEEKGVKVESAAIIQEFKDGKVILK